MSQEGLNHNHETNPEHSPAERVRVVLEGLIGSTDSGLSDEQAHEEQSSYQFPEDLTDFDAAHFIKTDRQAQRHVGRFSVDQPPANEIEQADNNKQTTN